MDKLRSNLRYYFPHSRWDERAKKKGISWEDEALETVKNEQSYLKDKLQTMKNLQELLEDRIKKSES